MINNIYNLPIRIFRQAIFSLSVGLAFPFLEGILKGLDYDYNRIFSNESNFDIE